MEKDIKQENGDTGTLHIADDVVGVIAGLAASEVRGVSSATGGSLVNRLGGGKKSLSKGVKVTVGEQEASIDMHIVVEYGMVIPEVAHQVQEKVKRAVESMTGLEVVEVNVFVQNVGIIEFKETEGRGN
ncbi:MAG TPA: Asp23/Gls24 family envelope stress response protein [Bacillota bacterium]|nr:Asp23/Gls24 family envelope stress response protein [Bacillota bacterium]